MLPIMEYDKVLIMFSGGKDSLACVLSTLESGVTKEKIELWHHDVDGNGETFMDWECTSEYCRAIANHLGIPIYYSWLDGGVYKTRERIHRNLLTYGY